MPQVVRQVLDQVGRLFLPALDFDDFREPPLEPREQLDMDLPRPRAPVGS
jgi:hypothetical protein